MTVVVATAGHIDHGKTSLLRALTGIDADRLPEERRRGMTIDVGYAHFRLADGDELDFVDVPGHDRLVGNMLVGAGEADAALLVVAADDGPRAQTLEHLELLDGLGISVGVAAITKTDIVDPQRVAVVLEDVVALLGRTTLDGSPVIAVSSVSGEGLDDLRAALTALRDRVVADRRPTGERHARLAVDRVFRVKGRGTVVTGTLSGGPLARGDVLRLEPGAGSYRARELQVHSHGVEAVTDGGRVAINIVGDDEPGRGGVLTTDPAVGTTVDVLAVLREPALLDRRAGTGRWPPRAGSTFRLHLGTDNVDATLGRGARSVASLPDGRLVARLRLARPVAAAIGDRFVLRHASPASTAAGGAILDVQAPIGPSRRRITPGLLEALATGSRDSRLAIHGILPAGDGPGWELAPDVAEAMKSETLAGIETGRGVASGPGIHLAELRRDLIRSLRRRVSVERTAAAVVVESLIDALVESGRGVRDGDVLRTAGVEPTGPDPDVIAAMDRLERIVDAATPPALSEAARMAGCPPEGVRRLEAEGRIVRLDTDVAYAQPMFLRLQSQALALAILGPLTPAALRDATGTSRKYVMALLDELDRRGVLARTPAGHVIGPRAPRAGSLGSPEPVAASRRPGE